MEFGSCCSSLAEREVLGAESSNGFGTSSLSLKDKSEVWLDFYSRTSVADHRQWSTHPLVISGGPFSDGTTFRGVSSFIWSARAVLTLAEHIWTSSTVIDGTSTVRLEVLQFSNMTPVRRCPESKPRIGSCPDVICKKSPFKK